MPDRDSSSEIHSRRDKTSEYRETFAQRETSEYRETLDERASVGTCETRNMEHPERDPH